MRITSVSFTDRSPYWSLQIMHIYLYSLSHVFPGPSAAWNQWRSVSRKAQAMNLIARRSDPTFVWVSECPPSTPVRLKHECEGNSPPENHSVGKYIIHFGSFDPFLTEWDWHPCTSCGSRQSGVLGLTSLGLFTCQWDCEPYCSVCPVTVTTERSHRWRRNFPKSPIQRKTPMKGESKYVLKKGRICGFNSLWAQAGFRPVREHPLTEHLVTNMSTRH